MKCVNRRDFELDLEVMYLRFRRLAFYAPFDFRVCGKKRREPSPGFVYFF